MENEAKIKSMGIEDDLFHFNGYYIIKSVQDSVSLLKNMKYSLSENSKKFLELNYRIVNSPIKITIANIEKTFDLIDKEKDNEIEKQRFIITPRLSNFPLKRKYNFAVDNFNYQFEAQLTSILKDFESYTLNLINSLYNKIKKFYLNLSSEITDKALDNFINYYNNIISSFMQINNSSLRIVTSAILDKERIFLKNLNDQYYEFAFMSIEDFPESLIDKINKVGIKDEIIDDMITNINTSLKAKFKFSFFSSKGTFYYRRLFAKIYVKTKESLNSFFLEKFDELKTFFSNAASKNRYKTKTYNNLNDILSDEEVEVASKNLDDLLFNNKEIFNVINTLENKFKNLDGFDYWPQIDFNQEREAFNIHFKVPFLKKIEEDLIDRLVKIDHINFNRSLDKSVDYFKRFAEKSEENFKFANTYKAKEISLINSHKYSTYSKITNTLFEFTDLTLKDLNPKGRGSYTSYNLLLILKEYVNNRYGEGIKITFDQQLDMASNYYLKDDNKSKFFHKFMESFSNLNNKTLRKLREKYLDLKSIFPSIEIKFSYLVSNINSNNYNYYKDIGTQTSNDRMILNKLVEVWIKIMPKRYSSQLEMQTIDNKLTEKGYNMVFDFSEKLANFEYEKINHEFRSLIVSVDKMQREFFDKQFTSVYNTLNGLIVVIDNEVFKFLDKTNIKMTSLILPIIKDKISKNIIKAKDFVLSLVGRGMDWLLDKIEGVVEYLLKLLELHENEAHVENLIIKYNDLTERSKNLHPESFLGKLKSSGTKLSISEIDNLNEEDINSLSDEEFEILLMTSRINPKEIVNNVNKLIKIQENFKRIVKGLTDVEKTKEVYSLMTDIAFKGTRDFKTKLNEILDTVKERMITERLKVYKDYAIKVFFSSQNKVISEFNFIRNTIAEIPEILKNMAIDKAKDRLKKIVDENKNHWIMKIGKLLSNNVLYKLHKEWEWEYKYEIMFMLGPVPIVLRFGMEAKVFLKFEATLSPVSLGAIAEVGGAVKAFGEGGVSLLLVELTAFIDGVIIKIKGSLEVELSFIEFKLGSKICFTGEFGNIMTGLRGRTGSAIIERACNWITKGVGKCKKIFKFFGFVCKFMSYITIKVCKFIEIIRWKKVLFSKNLVKPIIYQKCHILSKYSNNNINKTNYPLLPGY